MVHYVISGRSMDILSPKDMGDGEHVWDFNNNQPTPILEEFLYGKDGRIPLVKEKLAKYLPVDCPIIPVNGFYKYGLEELKRLIFAQ